MIIPYLCVRKKKLSPYYHNSYRFTTMKTSHIILLSLSAITLPIRMSAAYSETPDSMDLILNEVVVTGSNQAVSRDLTPYTVSFVSQGLKRCNAAWQVGHTVRKLSALYFFE